MSTKRDAGNEGSLHAAGWGVRFGALVIDWAASVLAVIAVYGPRRYLDSPLGSYGPLLVFFVEVVLFTVLVGGSFGQIALRLRVRHLDGSALSAWDVLVRSALICLVIPPLVYKPDGRGLHDLAVSSRVLRLV